MPEVSRAEIKIILSHLEQQVSSYESAELLDSVSREIKSLRLWEGMVMRDLCEITKKINELETKIFLKKKEAIIIS